MLYFKRIIQIFFLLILIIAGGTVCSRRKGTFLVKYAFAEKSDFYTSSEEFLPLGAEINDQGEGIDRSFLEDEGLIHNARLGGIKLLKEENQFVFTLKAENPLDLEGKALKWDVIRLNFPPRIILNLYGVSSEEPIFRFFKNLTVTGILLNPFLNTYFSELMVFFEDWLEVTGFYDSQEKKLILDYVFTKPEYTHGFGVRIADSKIDPLPHIIEIKKELTKFGLENRLLIASDYETVVLESPFYRTRVEAIEYMESLEGFGYNGKLALRKYRDFPKPHRFDVVSEVVIMGKDDVNLKNIVYTEFIPEKIYTLDYDEIYLITKEIFSPSVQNDENAISEYYYKLSEIYMNYDTIDEDERKTASIVSIKLLEIIYFKYPDSDLADDALWDIANIAREYGISNSLSEEDCYRKIINEYHESIFIEESKERFKNLKKQNIPMFY